MKRQWLPLLLAGVTSFVGVPAQAQSIYAISASHAQGLTGHDSPVINLWPGYGTNLSFLGTDETIIRVWIDDPSRIALDFDEPLCPATSDSDCEAGNPSIIHLRQIQGLEFEHLPTANGTLLTVMTETTRGDRHLYKFRVAFATGEPDYHTIAIRPSSPIDPLIGPMDVQRGLQIAEARKLISREQDLWNRLQTFLTLVRRGVAVPTAAVQAGVSLELITQLATWGAEARGDPILDATTR
ncbi:MAG: hypothetical protein AAFZ49_00485 [Cyanobacteria bacterium J06659_2]